MPDGLSQRDDTDNESSALGYQELVKLARDKSQESRSALLLAIADLSSGGERVLSPQDRKLIKEIAARLMEDVEVSVRHALATRLAKLPDVPRELVVCLANDEINVAKPLLLKSAVLGDPELIEIVQYRTMEHQLAIAMREKVSEPVSGALIETDAPEVVTTLLENKGAEISEPMLDLLAEKSVATDAYREPLVRREELPPRLAKKLYWVVSAALREHIVANFPIDAADLDGRIGDAVEDAFRSDRDSASAPWQLGLAPVGSDQPDSTPAAKGTDAHELLALLRDGDIPRFLDAFARLSKLRMELVRRILFEPGGEGMAIVCKAIGISKPDFVTMLLWFRQGRLGDKRVEREEHNRALDFFDRITREDSRRVMQRWQLDPNYLNALRLLEEAE